MVSLRERKAEYYSPSNRKGTLFCSNQTRGLVSLEKIWDELEVVPYHVKNNLNVVPASRRGHLFDFIHFSGEEIDTFFWNPVSGEFYILYEEGVLEKLQLQTSSA